MVDLFFKDKDKSVKINFCGNQHYVQILLIDLNVTDLGIFLSV